MRLLSSIAIGIFFGFFVHSAQADNLGNYVDIESYYEKAAEQGHALSQHALGEMYQKGEGVPQDFVQAREWFEKAAKQGYVLSQHALGLMYRKGEGVPQDFVQAREWFEKAAKQGHASAQFIVGMIHYKGEGVRQDFVQAREWFEKVAAQGHALSQLLVGAIYYKGEGVRQDFDQAREWFEKAAAQGNASAQYILGLMYHKGEGVRQDFVQARKWYEKAAKLGEKNAIEALDDLIFIALSEGAVNVRASQLYKNYSENEVRASLIYDGFPLVLEGKIDSIGFSPIASRPVLRFSIPSNSYASVQAIFKKEDAEYLAEMNKGEIVKVVCRGGASFSLVSVLVSDCVVP